MDLKWEYQKRADEIAYQQFGCDFYELDEITRDRIYEQAIQDVHELLQDNADSLRNEMELEEL